MSYNNELTLCIQVKILLYGFPYVLWLLKCIWLGLSGGSPNRGYREGINLQNNNLWNKFSELLWISCNWNSLGLGSLIRS